MSAGERKRYTVLEQRGDGGKESAKWIAALVATLGPGWVVTISPAGRSLDQNSLLHSLWDQLAKALPTYKGVSMDAESWKALTIVSHAIATKEPGGVRLVPDLEGSGLVQLRESSARMSKSRATSLTEYVLHVGAENGVQFMDSGPRH